MPTPPGWEPIGKPPGWEPAGAAEAATSPAPAAAPESGVTRFYKQYLAKPLTSAVSKGIQYGGTGLRALDPGEWPGLLRGDQGPSPAADTAAEFAVPQTPTQALTMAATGGAGKLASGLSRPLQALSRVTGGLIGNEAGNAVEGRGAGTGALATGGVLGAVEAAIPGLGMLGRRLPGVKGRVAAEDAAGYGRVMGDLSPPLAGAKTVQELRTMAGGPGQEALGAAKGAANAEISRGIGQRAGLLEIPSLGQTVQKPTAMNPTMGVQPVTVPQAVPKPMTLQEANDALSEIGAKAFSKNPLDRNFNGVDQRQKYGEVYNDILAALDKADPTNYSSAQFTKAQEAYKAGLALLKPLASDHAVRVIGNNTQFNTPYFQQWASNPKTKAALANKIGPEGYDALINTLTRGGGPDTRDVLASGAGRMRDAWNQSFGRGTNTGSTQYLGVPMRTLMPGMGNELAGSRQPFTASPNTMTAADLAALRALGVLPGSQP